MALSRSRGWSEGRAFDRRMRRGQGASLVTRPNTGAVWSKQTGLWVYGEDVAFTFVNVLNPWPNGRHEVQGDLFALIDEDCPVAIERDVEIGDWLLGVAGNLFALRPVPEGRFKSEQADIRPIARKAASPAIARKGWRLPITSPASRSCRRLPAASADSHRLAGRALQGRAPRS